MRSGPSARCVCRSELGCHPWDVCVPLSPPYLSGKESVNIWGSSDPVRATGRPLLLFLLVSPQAAPVASPEQGFSPAPLLHSAVWFSLSSALISGHAPSSSLICLWPCPVAPGLRPRSAGIHHWTWGEFQGAETLSAPYFHPPSPPAPPEAPWMERLGLHPHQKLK